MISSSGNEEQIEFWNSKAGLTWVESQERMDALLAPLSDMVVAKANAQSGERIIDVGCGCGATSLALASSGASVWGVDISAPMLVRAQQRAQNASPGSGALAFSEADATTVTLTPDHQLVFSRFGVMFFADSVAAFKNLRTGLTPGGRLCFVCWQAPGNNAWMSVAGKAVGEFLPKPATPPDPRAPGPFAFADADYLNDLLVQTGFNNIAIESITPTLHLADDIDEAMHFQSEIGPLSRALAELEGDRREQALAAARGALEAEMTADGLNLGSACWLVTATGS